MTAKATGNRGRRGGRRRRRTEPAEPAEEQILGTLIEPSEAVETIEAIEVPVSETSEPLPALSVPEPGFAARVLPPAPARSLPDVRRAIFFDVENSSRSDHVARVLAHLRIDRLGCQTELVAVGNWRVVNQDTARLLAQQGAHLLHSAPSVGVRDWSDLRIAVSAGVWLASARPGDAMVIISDDQAFDAAGDVAATLGVAFQRLSYRGLAGIHGELPEVPVSSPSSSRSSRRRRRGGRGRRRPEPSLPVRQPLPEPLGNGDLPLEAHTAPHDELLAVARELFASSKERAITLDTLSNALKAHGFRRTPGSPRLITRLRRIKELEVGRNGTIRLVGGFAAPAEHDEPIRHAEHAGPEEHDYNPYAPSHAADEDVADDAAGEATEEGTGEAAPNRRRRRRRRGGRGRRRRNTSSAAVQP